MAAMMPFSRAACTLLALGEAAEVAEGEASCSAAPFQELFLPAAHVQLLSG